MEKDNEKNEHKVGNELVDSKLTAVRELLFGENIQQYQKEFEDIRNQIAILSDDTNNKVLDLAINLELKIDNLQQTLETSIEKLSNNIDKRLAKLDDAKADRKKLGKALEKIAQLLQE